MKMSHLIVVLLKRKKENMNETERKSDDNPYGKGESTNVVHLV